MAEIRRSLQLGAWKLVLIRRQAEVYFVKLNNLPLKGKSNTVMLRDDDLGVSPPSRFWDYVSGSRITQGLSESRGTNDHFQTDTLTVNKKATLPSCLMR